MKKLTQISPISTFVLLALSTATFADSQLATDNPHYGEKGWDVEVSAGVGTVSDKIYISEDPEKKGFFNVGVNASYYGDSFYFIAGDEEGLLLGYSVLKQKDSAVDVILAPRFGGFDTSDNELKSLDERDVDLHAGLRYTKYLGDSLYKIEFSKDVSGAHGGSILSASYEKEWQQKNWIITGGVTASYISEKMMDYYFGVSDKEASAKFAAFNVDASSLLEAGIKAEYPISEHWVATAAVHHFIADGNVSSSPITVDNDQLTTFVTTIKYHF